MNKVYAVMEQWIDAYDERCNGLDLLRLFDSREKALGYIKDGCDRPEQKYEHIAMNDTYECCTDDGCSVAWIIEHDVY